MTQNCMHKEYFTLLDGGGGGGAVKKNQSNYIMKSWRETNVKYIVLILQLILQVVSFLLIAGLMVMVPLSEGFVVKK